MRYLDSAALGLKFHVKGFSVKKDKPQNIQIRVIQPQLLETGLKGFYFT